MSYPHHRRLRIEPLEERRLLAVVSVSNLNDVVNGDTSSVAALVGSSGSDGISLREAVLAANADSAADVIDFAPSLAGTIQLTNVGHAGELVVTNDLTINGPSANLITLRAFAGTTSSGDGARILRIDDATSTLKDVFVTGLTITGGDRTLLIDGPDGGAIFTNENLTLANCVISNNRLSGTSGRGGGIFSQFGSLTVLASTISGNTGGRGGGIYAIGANTTIRGSTISSNVASATSGNGGGGITLASAAGSFSTIINTTISGNQASSTAKGGGILNASAGTVLVGHSTVTLNRVNAGTGGGIYNNVATMTLDHTIAAGNLWSSSTCSDLAGSAAAIRFSLIGDNTGATITDNGGNKIGTGIAPIDPLLAPLAENAGPTLTHALRDGSPAIDAGDASAAAGVGTVPLLDQRGSVFVRVAAGDGNGEPRIDIGAYERQRLPNLSLVVDSIVDENDHDYSTGDLSLREAIELANGSEGPDSISFAGSLTTTGPAIILLQLGEIPIAGALSISGPGADLLTLSAFDPTPATKYGDGSRIFNIDDADDSAGSEVLVSGLTLTGGDTIGSGGAILSMESLTLVDSVLTGNASSIPTAISGGGAIYSGYGGDLTLIRCVIANNSALTEGGSIRKRGGHLVVQNSQIVGNDAGWVGGGISASDGVVVTISNSAISSNTSRASSHYGGGGLYFYNASVEIRDSLISGNSSLFAGGGIDAAFSSLSMTGSTLSGNVAASNGGGLRSSSGTSCEIAFSTITANTAPAGLGSGVWASGGDAMTRKFRSTILAGNTNSDVDGDASVFQSLGYNLIGTGNAAGLFAQPGDVTGVIDPLLTPLADHGGLTWTHALLPGSPALDAGDPAAIAGMDGVPLYDQRGDPFGRVVDGDGLSGSRIDIGAFEVISSDALSAAFGDYNRNGQVDAADYVLWRRQQGTAGVPGYAGADGSGNGIVGTEDYNVWRAHFGQSVPGGGAKVGESRSEGVVSANSSGNTVLMLLDGAESLPTVDKKDTLIPLESFVAKVVAKSFAGRGLTITIWQHQSGIMRDGGLLAWSASLDSRHSGSESKPCFLSKARECAARHMILDLALDELGIDSSRCGSEATTEPIRLR
ncbi:MAG: choice-of-anchor Q domain-containing protein [Pirellulales bacterium]